MARIAFILLAHKAPDAVAAQARSLTNSGNFVVVHFDRNAPTGDWRRLRAALKSIPRVLLLKRRYRCGWGQWSLCAATLAALRQGLKSFPAATHFYLVSGDCVPLTSARTMQARLDQRDCDHIETHDFFRSGWIKTGLKAERLVYRHWFNERQRPGAFYLSLRLQQLFGLSRKVPKGIHPRIGSQWWCLRRETVQAICRFTRKRRDVVRFFRSVWIPDEAFFQTLAAHLVPAAEIRNEPPTCLRFTDYGMPVVFHDDHLPSLASEEAFFIRKASPNAKLLRAALWSRFEGQAPDVQVAGSEVGGVGMLMHLASRGRSGRRTPPPPWVRNEAAGRGRSLIVIACKQWDLATKQAANVVAAEGNFGFVFDDGPAHLPDLGGFEQCVEARRRDPSLVLRLAMDAVGCRKAAICLDPSRAPLLEKLVEARLDPKILLLDVALTDGFLAGHGERLGFPAAGSIGPAGQALRDSLRCEIEDEIRVLEAMPGLSLLRMPANVADTEVAHALSRFLDIDAAPARDLSPTLAQLEG